MDFAPDTTTVDLVARMNAFLTECVYPAEAVLDAGGAEGGGVGGETDVANEGEAQATAVAVAVDRGDHG